MNYSTLDQTMEQMNVSVEIDALSVYRALEHIQDGRHKRGVRYSVALIFTLIMLAKGPGTTTPLASEQVTGEKQKEVALVSQFLTSLLDKGRVISADALHPQHAFWRGVTRWGGDYVLIAKGNQSILHDDLQLFFSEPPADCQDWRQARTVNKGHGRLEIRELVVSTELNDFLAGQWAGVAQVFRLTRTVIEDGKTRTEVVYGLTSLAPARACAARLLQLVRDHCAIENRLHWRRDVTLREDHCQVRKGDAPRVLAVLNSFLLAVLDFLGVSNVPEQMRFFRSEEHTS